MSVAVTEISPPLSSLPSSLPPSSLPPSSLPPLISFSSTSPHLQFSLPSSPHLQFSLPSLPSSNLLELIKPEIKSAPPSSEIKSILPSSAKNLNSLLCEDLNNVLGDCKKIFNTEVKDVIESCNSYMLNLFNSIFANEFNFHENKHIKKEILIECNRYLKMTSKFCAASKRQIFDRIRLPVIALHECLRSEYCDKDENGDNNGNNENDKNVSGDNNSNDENVSGDNNGNDERINGDSDNNSNGNSNGNDNDKNVNGDYVKKLWEKQFNFLDVDHCSRSFLLCLVQICETLLKLETKAEVINVRQIKNNKIQARFIWRWSNLQRCKIEEDESRSYEIKDGGAGKNINDIKVEKDDIKDSAKVNKDNNDNDDNDNSNNNNKEKIKTKITDSAERLKNSYKIIKETKKLKEKFINVLSDIDKSYCELESLLDKFNSSCVKAGEIYNDINKNVGDKTSESSSGCVIL